MEEILKPTKDDDYPILYKVLTIPGGCLGFLPSTVGFSKYIRIPSWRWDDQTSQKGSPGSRSKARSLSEHSDLAHRGAREVDFWEIWKLVEDGFDHNKQGRYYLFLLGNIC